MEELLAFLHDLELSAFKQAETLLEYSFISTQDSSLSEAMSDKRARKAFLKRKKRSMQVEAPASFDALISYLEEKQAKREGWAAREKDAIFKGVESKFRPMRIPFKAVDHPLAFVSLQDLTERLKHERDKLRESTK